ncbi:MAG: hypothetical protein IKI99_00300 [Firmicutes bacterium]|nr:hypothetical protein [Bacillota bacterium]
MKKFLGVILPALIGGICGAAGAAFGIRLMPEADGIGSLIVVILSVVVSIYLHIVLHEGGHLVCGLLSGYKFVSFRVGSLMLMKSNGKYMIKKFNIPGTGGQCLLDPPGEEPGNYPMKLYNLGGGLSNFLFSAIATVIVLWTDSITVKEVLIPFIILGVALGATNLIPMKVSGIANDGYNILSLDKDPVGRKAFWQQMRVNRLSSDGVRLKDMDEGLFDLAQSDVEGNPLIDQMKLFWMQRLVDEKRFEEAGDYGRRLVHAKDSIQIFKLMVGVELLYLELIGRCDGGVVKALYRKDIQKWMKSVKGYPSTHRVRYAYATRFAHDEKMAAKAKADFEKVMKTYPMLGEIETEKELFAEV